MSQPFENIPLKEHYERTELLAIMQRERANLDAILKQSGTPPVTGKELYFQTEVGTIRALGYRMEQPGILPLVVDLHGSGFVMCHAEMDDPYMPRLADLTGARILNVDYSLAPEYPFPQALHECRAILRYAQEHATQLGIDPKRIAVIGHSAGGNLAAALCMPEMRASLLYPLCCIVLDYPPLDIYTKQKEKRSESEEIISRIYNDSYVPEREARRNPLVSPAFADAQTLSTFPPALVVTAGYDSLCAEAMHFAQRLAEQGVEVTVRCFPRSLHGFTHSDSLDAAAAWQLMGRFLCSHFEY